MAANKAQIIVIGEALIELSGPALGTLLQSFGGDTLNTAVYMARLMNSSATLRYATALGNDALSEALIDRWRAEGIGIDLVLRDVSRLPGLYQIRLDALGERSFFYWRHESAARYLLQHTDFERVQRALAHAHLIYLSGISLAVLPAPDRTRLIELLAELAQRGVAIAFDTNYRPSLWSSAESARSSIEALLPATRLLFSTFDDDHSLWGDETTSATLARYHAAKAAVCIIKLGAAGCIYSDGAGVTPIAAASVAGVVDTTAAGDSFNAAFVAAWLAGMDPAACCKAGNTLAGIVIQHRGAIIPAAATPSLDELLAADTELT